MEFRGVEISSELLQCTRREEDISEFVESGRTPVGVGQVVDVCCLGVLSHQPCLIHFS